MKRDNFFILKRHLQGSRPGCLPAANPGFRIQRKTQAFYYEGAPWNRTIFFFMQLLSMHLSPHVGCSAKLSRATKTHTLTSVSGACRRQVGGVVPGAERAAFQQTSLKVHQMKRPCNPNHYGLDARSFLCQKSLYIKDYARF